MEIRVEPAGLGVIGELRDAYRREMACQIIHDSIHQRHGWTVEYAIWTDETLVGYGSVAVAGPWADDPAAYEFYLTPSARMDAFRLFGCFLRVAGVRTIEMQSNDVLGTAMLYAFAEGVSSESVLFEDGITTSWAPEGAIFRHPTAAEEPDVSADVRRWRAVVELGGVVAATGGVLFHYNPPYGDVYMDVAEGYRRRGLGTFLVQELKRLCHQSGRIPGARCRIDNVASRGTLQKAGFVPCGHVLRGVIRNGST